jgi:very-short-patch-repair endonuclease
MTDNTERSRFATNQKPSGKHAPLKYQSRGALLSAGELRFYRALREAVAERYLVMTKVRLTDLIEAEEGFHSPAGRKISQRHADFVLVTKRGLKIAAVVELDDKTHLEPEQQARDAYLADALHAAGVPLIRFPIYSRYDVSRVRGAIAGALRRFCSTPNRG